MQRFQIFFKALLPFLERAEQRLRLLFKALTVNASRITTPRFRTVFKVLLPFLVLAVSLRGAYWFMQNKPQAKRFTPPAAKLTVEATRLKAQDYQITIRSYGIVSPRTESTLIPQVSGEITRISPNFREGGFFEKGEILLEIDPRDYEAAVKIAQANLEQIRLTASKTTTLVEKTRLEQAKLKLQRTRIQAPFAGRIRSKSVDIGQFVSPGTPLAKIYAIDYVEIRLPLNNQQLEFVDLPEQYRNDADPQQGPSVVVTARVGQKKYQWRGRIVRTEGTIDRTSRQIFVIAQIDDPYSRRTEGTPPLKIGQFVTAEIEGKKLHNTLVIPRSTLYQGNEVVLIEKDKLQRKTVDVFWSDSQKAIITSGLKPGDVLALTSVSSLPSGTPVAAIIDGKRPERKKGKGPRDPQANVVKKNGETLPKGPAGNQPNRTKQGG